LFRTGDAAGVAAAMNVPVLVMENAGPPICIAPDSRNVEGINAFMERYKQGLVIERAAVEGLR
jgi:hypothetical protein